MSRCQSSVIEAQFSLQVILFEDETIGQEAQHTHMGDALLRVGVALYLVELGYCLHPAVPLHELKSLSVLVFFIGETIHAPKVTKSSLCCCILSLSAGFL